jgi:hypothetical protein
MREAADRDLEDAWQLSDGSAAQRVDIEDDSAMELALLSYAQRSAARAGAEWFAAEFARREEEEQSQRETVARWEPAQPVSAAQPAATASPEPQLVDASVEDNVIGGAPAGLGIAPPPPAPVAPAPAVRHPHVPRPPAPPEPPGPSKRRRWGRAASTEPAPAAVPPQISAPEWARMSPGARKLYGVDDAND